MFRLGNNLVCPDQCTIREENLRIDAFKRLFQERVYTIVSVFPSKSYRDDHSTQCAWEITVVVNRENFRYEPSCDVIRNHLGFTRPANTQINVRHAGSPGEPIWVVRYELQECENNNHFCDMEKIIA